jgi:hypothetical protein
MLSDFDATRVGVTMVASMVPPMALSMGAEYDS